MARGRKTGGRVRGTPNRRTVEVTDMLESLGCNPIEGLARIADDDMVDVGIRVQCYKELAQYAYPKRRALEVNSGLAQHSHVEWLQIMESESALELGSDDHGVEVSRPKLIAVQGSQATVSGASAQCHDRQNGNGEAYVVIEEPDCCEPQ